MKDLRGANAIVTGASKGLGVYIALSLARRGVRLTLAARSKDLLEDVSNRCWSMGSRAVAVPTDVTSFEDLGNLVATARETNGPVDILINNAGIRRTASLMDHSSSSINEIIQVNLTSAICLTKLVLPEMISRRRGSIVQMASIAGKTGEPYASVYSATKAGLIGFTNSLNMELRGTGVTASAVCPGYVSEVGMWRHEGLVAPFLLREVSPQQVVNAVVRGIRGDPQVPVTSRPMRPVLAACELVPRLNSWLAARLGVIDMMRRQAGGLHTTSEGERLAE